MLTYFLQVSLCWLVFYGLYYSLLSRETFFRLNRIYLIVSLLAGLLVPLGQYFIQVETRSQAAVMLEPFVVTAKGFQQSWEADTTEGGVSLRFFITLIYGLGVGVISWRFFSGLYSVWAIYKQGEKIVQDGVKVVYTESIKSTRQNVHLPFSFFRCIFINQAILDKQDIPQIMEHERAHVQQGHSYDVMLLEVLKIVFWCNPIIYFYRHSLRNIHEYLADAAVLKWVERPIYGRLLIKQSQSGPALALANHFIFSQLKKRIIMMTRNRSQRSSLLKYVIAFPLFTFLLILFAIPNSEVMAKTKDLGEKAEEEVETIDNMIKENRSAQSALKTKNNLPVSTTSPKINEKPVAALGDGTIGGLIAAENFKNQTKLICVEGSDRRKSKRIIVSFVIVWVPRQEDPMQVNNTGGAFNAETSRIIKMAKPGDVYNVMNIRATDGAEVFDMGGTTFFIKDSKSSGDLYDVPPATKQTEPIRSTIPQERSKSSNLVMISDTIKDDALTVVDEVPEYEGGMPALFKWLGQNIRYPKIARDNNIQGTVFVGFIVEKDGSISGVEIIKGVKGIVRDTIVVVGHSDINGVKGSKIVEREDHSIDNEAKRVIAAMPKWRPGRQQGKAVRVRYTLPIKFKLE